MRSLLRNFIFGDTSRPDPDYPLSPVPSSARRGLLCGISSGANVWGARKMAEKIRGNIATILPDRAERYFSTSLL